MVADHPLVLVVQHEEHCPPAWVGTWLEEAGCRLDVRRPDTGEALPADLSGHDAMVVLGGHMGAHDDAEHAWLAPTKGLVRDAAARSVPTLGICLGHQLAAVALGGRVGRNPHGQQLGLTPVAWTPAAATDALLGAVASAEVAVHWNDDVVLERPDGTVALALGPDGSLQAARFAPTVWGVQLHPEADEQVIAAWATIDRERHAEGHVDQAVAAIAAARSTLADAWRGLAGRLASLAGANP